MTPKLTLQIVSWNSSASLPLLFGSLQQSHFRDFRITVIDNASADDSLAIVKKFFPTASIIQNPKNVGFAAAHNQGIRIAETPYIGLVNPDVEVSPDAIGLLVAKLDASSDIGSVGGKLLKKKGSPAIIDSAGILARRNREFLNRGEGEEESGQYDSEEEVFGLSGAFVLFRRDALEAIRIGHEYLDEDFFAYKEDIDYSWRLRLAGWKNWYLPRAVIVHARTVDRDPDSSMQDRRKSRSIFVKRLSYRNHLLLLLKNDRVRDLLFPWPRAPWYELRKFFYLLAFERGTLLGLVDAVRLFRRMHEKRLISLRHRKISPRALHRWFV